MVNKVFQVVQSRIIQVHDFNITNMVVEIRKIIFLVSFYGVDVIYWVKVFLEIKKIKRKGSLYL